MDTETKQTAGMHGNGMVMQADTVQGLAVSAGGLTLALGLRMATPGRRFQLRFRILDEHGRTAVPGSSASSRDAQRRKPASTRQPGPGKPSRR